MKHELQPGLFPEPQHQHDYGGQFDASSEAGHEFPFVMANKTIEMKVDKLPVQTPEGVSINLSERRDTLIAIAAMYGRANRNQGLQKAKDIPEHRAKIQSRYRRDIDDVADRANFNSMYTPELERRNLQPIIKEREMIEAGLVDEADADIIAKSVLRDVRQAFGRGVDSKTRQANLRRLNK